MLEKGRISIRQITVLMFIFLLGETIVVYPNMLTSIAKQDAWISSILGVSCGVLLVWVLLRLHHKYPSQNLIQIAQTVLGKWIGGMLSLWYLFYFYLSTGLYVRQIADFLVTQYFNNTPLSLIVILFIILLIWGVTAGIEPIARSAELLLPILLLASAFLVISLLPQSDTTQLKPLLENRPLSILHAAVMVIANPYGQSIVFTMLLPMVNKQPHLSRDVLLAAIAGGTLLTVILLTSLLVIGPFLSEGTLYPTFFMAKKISIGDFLQRLEAFLATAWIITAFFKTVLSFYATILGTAQLFRLKNYRSLIRVAAMVIFGLTLIVAPDLEYYMSTFPPYGSLWDLTNGLVIPLLLLLLPAWSLRKNKPTGHDSA
ncbi:GerAB/ArcD/ProY family transporter [Paenibacillus sp. HW567]|uniref:GerAB/ArcD/ProY family transporter n=1 Tax=Paenibacillus sp. HW567 TaxID=1034769 RepID=UPI00036D7089|nr:endospore germination permease [Paenibacillus sp. HW567]